MTIKSHFLFPLIQFFTDRRFHQILWFCVPALLLGIGLRMALIQQMPRAFMHTDTRYIISTADKLQNEGKFEIDQRRTFLAPTLYSVPILFNWPFLQSVALGQHALGLLLIILCGLLTALWLKHWKWCVIPYTLLMALHPVILWYEHMALPEFLYVFSLVLLALAGTFFYRQPQPLSFFLLLIATILVAGARSEGRFFCFFSIALVIITYREQRRNLLVFGALILLCCLVLFKATKTSQNGQMLLTSVLYLMPERLWTAPDLTPALKPLQEKIRREWELYLGEHNTHRKKVAAVLQEYLIAQYQWTEDKAKAERDAFAKRIAFEISLRNFWHIPGMTFDKFLLTHRETPSGDFGTQWTLEEQTRIFFEIGQEKATPWKYSDLLLGQFHETPESLKEHLQQEYRPFDPDWLSIWQKKFVNMMFYLKFPDRISTGQRIPGLPIIYLFSLGGWFWILFQGQKWRKPQLFWFLNLIFVGIAVFSVANFRARYRLGFEPFLWIGIIALLDLMITLIKLLVSPKK